MSRLVLAGALVVSFVLGGALPARADPLPLSPEGRAALAEGLTAAGAGRYAEALTLFTKAFGTDPEVPEIWLNLGLASARLPGREYRALAFLKAYVLAGPRAADRSKLEALMSRLEAVIAGRLLELVGELERSRLESGGLLERLAETQALVGLPERALANLTTIVREPVKHAVGDPDPAVTAVVAVGEALADAGHGALVEVFVPGIALNMDRRRKANPEDERYLAAYDGLYSAAAAWGDRPLMDAVFARVVKDPDVNSLARFGVPIACREWRAANVTAARTLLAQQRDSIIAAIQPGAVDILASIALMAVAQAQLVMGDLGAARRTAAAVEKTGMSSGVSLLEEMRDAPWTYREHLPGEECWYPELRRERLLRTGLHGFQVPAALLDFKARYDVCGTDSVACVRRTRGVGSVAAQKGVACTDLEIGTCLRSLGTGRATSTEQERRFDRWVMWSGVQILTNVLAVELNDLRRP